MLEKPNNDTAIQDMTPNGGELPTALLGFYWQFWEFPCTDRRRGMICMYMSHITHGSASRNWRLCGGNRKRRRRSFCVIPFFSSYRGIQEYFPWASAYPKNTSSLTAFWWSLVTGLAPVLVPISESATNILQHPHSSRQSVCVRLVIIGISHSTAAGCSGRNTTSSGKQTKH